MEQPLGERPHDPDAMTTPQTSSTAPSRSVPRPKGALGTAVVELRRWLVGVGESFRSWIHFML